MTFPQTAHAFKPDEADRFWNMYLGDVPLEGATVQRWFGLLKSW